MTLNNRVPEIPTDPDPFTDGDWNGDPPQPSVIAGTVLARTTRTTDKFGKSKTAALLTLATEEGTVNVACWRAHLVQLEGKNDPQPGDGIVIKAFGLDPDDQKFHYAMRVQKATTSPTAPTSVHEPLTAQDSLEAEAATVAAEQDEQDEIDAATADDIPF